MLTRSLFLKLLSAVIVFGAWQIAGMISGQLCVSDLHGIDGCAGADDI